MDVLIIHDDQAAMEQLAGIVSVFDVSIVSGAGLDDLEDTASGFDPQLFLVSYDLQMGEALLEKLRDRFGDIRSDQIIFLIDDGGDADVRESLLASGADVLVAPFVEGEVRTRVSYHIKVATLEKEHASSREQLAQQSRTISQFLPSQLQEDLQTMGVDGLRPRKKAMAIVYTDIRGFTAFSDTYPPEVVFDLLNFNFYFLFDIILAMGGKIDKVIGDAILATVSDEDVDDPQRVAVEMCMKIQSEMEAFNDIVKSSPRFNPDGNFPDLEIGIGINYDEVMQGHLGTHDKMEYTIIGDGVNVAARCQGFATGGEVVITDSVYQAVQDVVEVGMMPPAFLKGKPEPVQLYKVLSFK